MEVAGELSVIVRQGEVHRLDPLEVLGIERVLQPGPAADLQIEESGQGMNDRIQHRDVRNAQTAAAIYQPGA